MPGIIELEHMHRYALAVALSKGKRVLDVASGEGYGSHLLASVAESVIGVDISPEAIKNARQNYSAPNLDYRQGSCAALPIDDGSIDLVVSFETIEHHDQHQEMMREIIRVLRPDGLLLISSPNKKNYSDIPGTHNSFHVKELYRDDFIALLEQYFSNVALYGQRVLTSSVVAPLLPAESEVRLLQQSDAVIHTADNLESAIYFVALASRTGPLPSLGVSIYESETVSGLGNDSQMALAIFEIRMYWRPHFEQQYSGYSEQRSVATTYKVDGKSHQIRLDFPKDTGKVTRIRLDITNTVCVIDIKTMQLLAPDQSIIWQWQGDTAIFQKRIQLVLLANGESGQGGCTVVTLGNDPWFELDLPADICAQLKPDCALSLAVTPYSLLDQLPGVLNRLAHLEAQPQSEASTLTPAPLSNREFQPHLVNDLKEVAVLLRENLASRDQTLAYQHQKLQQMREELLRAEAQLELLKDVLLKRMKSDRL